MATAINFNDRERLPLVNPYFLLIMSLLVIFVSQESLSSLLSALLREAASGRYLHVSGTQPLAHQCTNKMLSVEPLERARAVSCKA